MEDGLKAKFFRDLAGSEVFKAQLALEDETYNSLLNRFLVLDVKDPSVGLEYARLRGAIDVLKSLKAHRDRLTELARSRESNS